MNASQKQKQQLKFLRSAVKLHVDLSLFWRKNFVDPDIYCSVFRNVFLKQKADKLNSWTLTCKWFQPNPTKMHFALSNKEID